HLRRSGCVFEVQPTPTPTANPTPTSCSLLLGLFYLRTSIRENSTLRHRRLSPCLLPIGHCTAVKWETTERLGFWQGDF
ncbi:hypothetical protein HPP92_026417, partial [Vanilla planifolia]